MTAPEEFLYMIVSSRLVSTSTLFLNSNSVYVFPNSKVVSKSSSFPSMVNVGAVVSSATSSSVVMPTSVELSD